jgi:hypothetical protein
VEENKSTYFLTQIAFKGLSFQRHAANKESISYRGAVCFPKYISIASIDQFTLVTKLKDLKS